MNHVAAATVLALATTLVVSPIAADDLSDPVDAATWIRIEDPEYVGFIVPLSCHTSKEEIAEFESELRKVGPHESSSYLDRFVTELHRYRRYYLCSEQDGKRMLRVLFFHEESRIVAEGTWGRELVTVSGGGDDYAKATYDIESKRILWLMPNHP